MASFFMLNVKQFILISCFFLSGCSLFVPAMPPILYLGWDDADNPQIYRQDMNGSGKQLSDHPDGIYDFAISPDAQQVVYSVLSDSGDSAIGIMDASGRNARELITCKIAQCSNLVWAPDNRRIVYERRERGADGILGLPRLYWLDTRTVETVTLLDDASLLGYGVRFSPDGQWVSFISPVEEGVFVQNLEDGRSHFLANEVGTPVAWSPDSKQLVVANLDLVILHGEEGEDHQSHTHDFQSGVLLSVFNLETGIHQQISPDMRVDDGNPAWSPEGDWLVIGRKVPRTAAGRQLWLMRPDGSDAQPLTEDFIVHHGPASWSPDGRYLLFQRFSLDEPAADPAIWRLDVETGEMIEMATSGMLPVWLSSAG